MKRPLLSLLAAIALSTSSAFAQSPSGVVLPQSEFQALSQQSGIKILDIRSKAEYDKGHIPGAIHLPWQALNVSERDGIRNEYVEDQELEKTLSAAGLSYDDTLLVYGATSLAGRAFVVLDYAGFDKLHVLDGGISQWKGKLSTQATQPKPSQFSLAHKRENRVEIDYVQQHIDKADTLIVDGRVPAATVDGVIPSAKAFSSFNFVDPKTSIVRPRQELLSELAAQGITPDKEIIAYCGSGAAASSSFLFLKELGFDNVKFYDKSWDEWVRTTNGQELALGNFNFTGDALQNPSSLGPRFLDETQVKQLQKDGAVIVDVRPGADFVVGNIPGSVNVFWNDTLDEQRNLKPLADLKKLFEAQGVTRDKHVVIFARGGVQLAQTYTVLKLLGFDKVNALEGKWEGWVNPAYGTYKG